MNPIKEHLFKASTAAASAVASFAIIFSTGCSRPAENLAQGLDALRAGDAKTAIRKLDRAAKKLSPSSALQYNRGAALYALGRYDDAEEAFKASLAIEPDDPQTMEFLGYTLLKKSRWDDAGKIFRDAMEFSDNQSDLLAAMSLADLGKGRPDIARLHLLQILLGDPANAVAYYNLAKLYEGALNMPTDACLHYGIFLGCAPADSPFREAASAAVERLNAAGANPGNPLPDATLHRDQARARSEFDAAEKARKARKFTDAVAAYSRALSADPLFFEAAFNQGLAYRERPDMASAIRSFQKAVDIRPGNIDALYLLAHSAYANKDFDTASQALDLAIARERRDPRLFRLMSCVRANQKRFAEAREYGEYYLLLNPKDADTAEFAKSIRSFHD